MGFYSMLVQVTWVGVMLTIMAAAAIAYPLALPNCSDSCGDVKFHIPLAQLKVVTSMILLILIMGMIPSIVLATPKANLNQ